jgi:hypothetical protein
VKSVSFLNSHTAQVRFTSTETMRASKSTDAWVAILSFRFVNLPETEEERFINPLGFQVTAYRLDQELVQRKKASDFDPRISPPAPIATATIPAINSQMDSSVGEPVNNREKSDPIELEALIP